MAAVKLGLDLDSRKFSDVNGATVQSLVWKKGTVVDYQLTILQGGVGVSLPSGTTVEVGIKKTTDPAGTLLFHADATASGWGSGSKWFFRLDLTGPSFADPTILGKSVDFEVLITIPDGQRFASLTISLTIAKNVQV
jgi:hypothetical protein